MAKQDDFGLAVSHSNVIGDKLEKEVAPQIIKNELGIDPKELEEKFLPNKVVGINYDLVTNKNDIVFWVFKAGPRLNKTAFQKHLGELIFLRKHQPKTKCGIVFGIGESSEKS